jgi:Ca2+-transporting ATPase
MIWFLPGTSALYAAVGQRVEALTLAAAIVPVVAMDVFLHRRTRASTTQTTGVSRSPPRSWRGPPGSRVP